MSDRELVKEVIFSSIDVAKKMWENYKKLKKQPNWLKRTSEEKMTDFRSMDGLVSDFMSKYKVVSRCMITHGEFNTKVFERYLTKLKTKGYTTQEEWAEREADYVKWLYMAYNPHSNENLSKQIWLDTKTKLMDEENQFKKDYAEAEKKAEITKKETLAEQKKEILEMIKKNPKLLDVLKSK
jgi:hypothetical protein